jgi:hypothetical protein
MIEDWNQALASRFPGTCLDAVMRKLLVLAYGILRSGKRFDPNYA